MSAAKKIVPVAIGVAALLATALPIASAAEPLNTLASNTASTTQPVVPGGQCYGKVGSSAPADPNKCRRILVLKHIGPWVYAGGIIDQVTDRSGSTPVTTGGYHNIFRFNAATGAVDTSFKPQLYKSGQSGAGLEYADSAVTGIASDGLSIFAAGSFTTVAATLGGPGAPMKGVASLNPNDGSLNTTFNANIAQGGGSAVVNDVEYVGGTLWLGGLFNHVKKLPISSLVFVNPASGALASSAPTVSGQVTTTVGTKVAQIAVNSNQTKAAVIGNFTTVGGYTHDEVVVLDIGAGGSATVDTWNSPALAASNSNNCKATDTWARGVDWSPDNVHFNVVASGGGGFDAYRDFGALCDAFTRFDSTKVNAAPDIVNNTGFDSLFTVADTGGYAYTGGHNKMLDYRIFINGVVVPKTVKHDHAGIGAIDVNPTSPNYGHSVAGFNDGDVTGRGAGWASSLSIAGLGVYIGGDSFNYNGDASAQRLVFLPGS